AEDGIRDATVTGVQTCALPIYVLVGLSRGRSVLHPGPAGHRRTCSSTRRGNRGRCPREASPIHGHSTQLPLLHCVSSFSEREGRSEERRVGKEGSSGLRGYSER